MRPAGTRMSTIHPILSRFVIGVAILAIPVAFAFDGQTVWMTTERAPVIEDASAHAEHPRSVSDGNGGVDKTVKWDNGGISGGPLDVEASLNEAGDALTVIVPLADVVTACPDDPSGKSQCVIWQIETQGGIQGGSGLGFLDRARDELTVTPVP